MMWAGRQAVGAGEFSTKSAPVNLRSHADLRGRPLPLVVLHVATGAETLAAATTTETRVVG